MDLLENNELISNGLIYNLSQFQSNFLLMKRELLNRFNDFDPEIPRFQEGKSFLFFGT
jgi:hypothetical protein